MYTEAHENVTYLIKLDDVIRLTTLSKSTIYKLIKSGKFPAPVKLCGRAIAFVTQEVSDWISEQLVMRNDIAAPAKEAKCN